MCDNYPPGVSDRDLDGPKREYKTCCTGCDKDITDDHAQDEPFCSRKCAASWAIDYVRENFCKCEECDTFYEPNNGGHVCERIEG